MLDNIKLSTFNVDLIQRVFNSLQYDFVETKSKNNYYQSFIHKTNGAKFRLDFRKVVKKNYLIGYCKLEIGISPHYHFNNYNHNGNDFSPDNCIKSVIDILTYLGIVPHEYNDLKVENLEVGVNVHTSYDVRQIIDGTYFSKKTPFVKPYNFYYKCLESSFKKIKIYAKGLQFQKFSQYEIAKNTLRFEIKTKQYKKIKTFGITSVNDLFKIGTYQNLANDILKEWENILITNLEPDFSDLRIDEVQFIRKAQQINFWNDILHSKNRNKFARYKAKYYKLLQTKNNLHHLIKLQIIDKLFQFLDGANSTQKTPINRGKVHFEKTPPQLINLEYAPPHQNNKVCLVTGLDISMQKKGSKFLCITGIKYYKEKDPKIYNWLVRTYLTEKSKLKSIDRQNYYIAHCIRNVVSNKIHNRKRFENRNYNPNQLRLDI